jgi:hypothetical protein
MASLQRYFKYNESVVFSISRVEYLRWQHSKRSSWACPHGEKRGEKHGDYSEERRAQRGEGHKENCAHCGSQGDAIAESANSQSFPFYAAVAESQGTFAVARTRAEGNLSYSDRSVWPVRSIPRRTERRPAGPWLQRFLPKLD